MSYSIKEAVDSATGEAAYVVVDSTGVTVPPPNTFATRDAAVQRLAELSQAEPPLPGMRCYGKIVAVSDTLLIQHLGKNKYALHRRADSDAFNEIAVGDLVRVLDGEVVYPSRERSSGLSM